MLRRFLIALVIASAAGAASADMTLTGVGGNMGGGCTAAYCGPGDIVSGALAWGSCQFAYSSAVAAAATQATCNLRRASDSHTCDVIIATSGSWGNTANCSTGGDNGQSASSFCNATTCSVTKLYDQTGNGNNFTQATAAKQPTITFSGVGSNAVMTFASASSQSLLSVVLSTSISYPATQSFVVKNTNTTTQSPFMTEADAVNNEFQTGANVGSSSANHVFIFSGTIVQESMTDSAYHDLQAVYNGASSAINIDGTEFTGLNPGTSLHTDNQIVIGTDFNTFFMSGSMGEAGVWLSAFSSGQRANMCHNQSTRWGVASC